MKKCMLLSGLIAIALIALTACQDIHGTAVRHTEAELEPTQEVYTHATAYDEVVHSTSWQEAYAEKLSYYTQQLANLADMDAEWRFMLHDINQYGIPQLFLVRYHDGLVGFHTVYSFEDGNAIRLKSALCVNNLLVGGMYIAPGGTGVIRYLASGVVSHYERLAFSGTSLSRTVVGDASPLANSLRINNFPVTEEEFEYTFGCDERVWLTLYEITEANVQDAIFGW